MKLIRASLPTKPIGHFLSRTSNLSPNVRWVNDLPRSGARFMVPMATSSTYNTPPPPPPPLQASSPAISPDFGSGDFYRSSVKLQSWEENIEKVIYRCRFFAILAVWGSLVGSFLCFIKGCVYVVASYQEYLVNHGKMILMLVEAIDVYLLGTVMLVFGMGLYELFISNLDIAKSLSDERVPHRSNLFGLFTLKERPQWLEIKSVNQLKTKLGHVIVMLLLIGLFDKSNKAVIITPLDLLCFSASVFVSSACLFLLSRLKGSK